MSAATSHVTVSMSERDAEDGITVNPKVRRMNYDVDVLDGQRLVDFFWEADNATVQAVSDRAQGTPVTNRQGDGSDVSFTIDGKSENLMNACDGTDYVVTDLNGTEITSHGMLVPGGSYLVYTTAGYNATRPEIIDSKVINTSKSETGVTLGNSSTTVYIYSGNLLLDTFSSLAAASDFVFDTDSYTDYQVVVELTYDHVGSDNTAPDQVDDRDQAIYTVYLETAPGSGKYEAPVSYYCLDNDEDFVKLMNADELVNVPGQNDRAGKNGQYMYVYTVDGDKIYANWEEVVTGLKWDDKKNACVTTSGNAVVTVPDTSAR